MVFGTSQPEHYYPLGDEEAHAKVIPDSFSVFSGSGMNTSFISVDLAEMKLGFLTFNNCYVHQDWSCFLESTRVYVVYANESARSQST